MEIMGKRLVKLSASACVLLLAALSLFSCSESGIEKAESLPAENYRTIKIQNANGSVSVRSDPDSMDISILGSITTQFAIKREPNKAHAFDTESRGDTLFISGSGAGKDFETVRIDLAIPDGFTVIVDQNNGNTAFRGAFKWLEVDVESGSVSGEIRTGHLDVNIANGSANIDLPLFDRKGYYLVSVGCGSLDIGLPESAEGTDIRAWSENGPIKSDFGLSADPSIGEFVVGNGPVTIALKRFSGK